MRFSSTFVFAVAALAFASTSHAEVSAEQKLKLVMQIQQGDKLIASPALVGHNNKPMTIKVGTKDTDGSSSGIEAKLTPSLQPDQKVKIAAELTITDHEPGSSSIASRKMSVAVMLELGKEGSIKVGDESIGLKSTILRMTFTNAE